MNEIKTIEYKITLRKDIVKSEECEKLLDNLLEYMSFHDVCQYKKEEGLNE